MDFLEHLTRWGIALVFGSVLLEQAGLPLPAAPILVGAGALAQDGSMRPELVVLVALLASLLADHAWFLAGRKRGRALLAGICRVSLSPDSCVRRTDDLVARHGAALLVVAKFIPGVSAVTIPTVAAMGVPYRRFLLFDTLGCALWCGSYVGLGMIFSRGVHRVFDAMASVGGWSLAVVGALFAAYIGAKLLHRHRLRRLYRLVRIGPHEVAEMLAREESGVLILDARSRLARADDPRTFRESIDFGVDDELEVIPLEARGKMLVTFCTCPNEASAAFLAERLLEAGFERVRVLTGGSEALALLASEGRAPVP